MKWVHLYYLKGQNEREFFPNQASWMLKKIFKASKTFEEVGLIYTQVKGTNSFSIKSVYLKLRGEHPPKVAWRRLICNNFRAPK